MKRNRLNKPRFNLKEPSAKTSIIYLIFVLPNRKRFKYSTGKKVIVKYWDKSTGLAKETLKYPEGKAINLFLRALQNHFIDVLRLYPNLETSVVKKKLDQFSGLSLSKEMSESTLIDFVDEYIRQSKLHYRTIQKYQGLRNHLNSYSIDRGMRLTFDKITLEWKDDFIEYISVDRFDPLKPSKRIKGIKSANTLNKVTVMLKKMMRESSEKLIIIDGELKPMHQNFDFRKKDFVVQRVKTTKHFIEPDEIAVLMKYEYPPMSSYAIVKDFFCLMCYTGLRWSDIIRLSKDHFIGENIQMHTYKGRDIKADTEVVIPVLPEVTKIMEKYDFQLPKTLAEQKHNDYIKKILKEVGITRIVIHKESCIGDLIETPTPINEKISNHSGRYTFINMMINEFGISPMELTKVTGQSLKVLLGYERGNKVKNANTIMAKINSKKLRLAK